MIKILKRYIFLAVNCSACFLFGGQTPNQTDTLSPILINFPLPFQISIELADFLLPNGLHSYVQATYDGKWLFLAGRTNGLHGFGPGFDNFPPPAQNQIVYVVDPAAKTVVTKSLASISSGLNQQQIDSLSVTSPQFYTLGSTLYITGGYGVDSRTGLFSTKDTLTAIDIPGLMHWVTDPGPDETAAQYIRQIFDPIFQVTGGYMTQFKHHPTLLVFGQNFKGFYNDNSNGLYSELVRRFHIIDDGDDLDVKILSSKPKHRESFYRRRDLNVVPIIQYKHGRFRQQLIAFSGVFTVDTGVWTVPVVIKSNGKPSMLNPHNPEAFKQGMNNYVCPTIAMFSKDTRDMYTLFLGGISYGFFVGNEFMTDEEIPFINQVTAINYDRHGRFTQYLMDAEYPEIISTQSNPGNPLLFGAGAMFIPANGVEVYGGDVLNLDALIEPTVIGYVVGGIQSTLPNTNTRADSAASPYIFKVVLSRP